MNRNRVLYYFLLCLIVAIVASYVLVDSTFFMLVAILGSFSMLPFIYGTLRDYDNRIKNSLLKNENNKENENENNNIEVLKDSMSNNRETVEHDEHNNCSLNFQINNIIYTSINEYHSIYRNLLSKASAYLILGFMTSILGLVTFVYMTKFFNTDIIIKSLESLYNLKVGNYIAFSVIQNLPRFGVLFFIEYIALFFLKQYRFLMGECRYYLKVKREIESQYIMICLIKEYQEKPEIIDKMIVSMDKYTSNSQQCNELDKPQEVLDVVELTNRLLKIIENISKFNKS